MHCTCKFEKHKQSNTHEKHKQSFPSENYNWIFPKKGIKIFPSENINKHPLIKIIKNHIEVKGEESSFLLICWRRKWADNWTKLLTERYKL